VYCSTIKVCRPWDEHAAIALEAVAMIEKMGSVHLITAPGDASSSSSSSLDFSLFVMQLWISLQQSTYRNLNEWTVAERRVGKLRQDGKLCTVARCQRSEKLFFYRRFRSEPTVEWMIEIHNGDGLLLLLLLLLRLRFDSSSTVRSVPTAAARLTRCRRRLLLGLDEVHTIHHLRMKLIQWWRIITAITANKVLMTIVECRRRYVPLREEWREDSSSSSRRRWWRKESERIAE